MASPRGLVKALGDDPYFSLGTLAIFPSLYLSKIYIKVYKV